MSTVLLLGLAFISVLAEIAFAPGAGLLGVRPQLTLVMISLWSALRPEAEAMLLAPAAGLMLGLLANEPLGVSVLAFAPIVLLSGIGEHRSPERRFAFTVGLTAAGTLAYALIYAVFARVLGEGVPVGLGSLRALTAVAAVNAALAALLYWPLARISGDTGARNELRRY